MQTKKQSLRETCVSTAIGFVGSWLISFILAQHISGPALLATCVTVACTVWSLVRGYHVRRHYARKHAVPPDVVQPCNAEEGDWL